MWRKKGLGNAKVLVWRTKKSSVILLFEKKKKIINPGVLQFDLNQILFQVLTSAFDLGEKKLPTQEPIIIMTVIIIIILNFGTKVHGFRGGWLFPSA